MCTFLLIRHASHDYLGRAIAGWLPGVHINERGREEAPRLAETLAGEGIEALYSSPLDRTMDTAAVIAHRLGLTTHVEEAFGEVRFGEWTGATFEDLDRDPRWQAYNRFRSGTRPPDGELLLEVQARVIAAMERIRDDHPHGTVAVVSHGDVIKSAVMYYLGMPLDLLERFEISPASVTAIKVGDWGAQVLRLNA
ncbi:MAG TPA: histidine phosphatase family protein [Bryobacteraceae bacterium]|nr:histidine phosphatase family protein [Bryobacteraceae bacterium]